MPSKYVSLIVRPDWRIFDFFDSWRIGQPTMRCQDCLELDSKSYQLAFDDAIYPILQDFQESTSYFNEPPFVIAGEGNKEVYRTDSRIGKGKQLERKGA
ncbi:hypothetical protein [Olivibacter jilunii]|uniref:hypothetical protein n=1 Tax=Olivibacter jilunii TaxID=985016 RepID=UPI003F182965